jgi:cold shock CspA family protein
MHGKVKWFSSEKGYGFITRTLDDGYQDYFLHISDVVGPDAPQSGDTVTFSTKETKKGEAATDVRIVSREEKLREDRRGKTTRDDRVMCIKCGKRMVPRIQFKNGEPHARICPFCMASQEPGCFIATAVFDGQDAPAVLALRQFRDRRLSQSRWGIAFVNFYYRRSPKIALWIEQHPVLKKPMRVILSGIARTLRN